MWVKELSSDEKLAIAAACERFTADVLKPRFIPDQLHRLDHPPDIFGKWRGSKYGFSARYRSDDGEEFNTPFARSSGRGLALGRGPVVDVRGR
ncbi:hypothetical protein [Mesorhizobium loti]|uniref:hypothetical protein n=1 Tax=Rhizobium loti TaxID=381 RepID=UPI0004166FE5|nr:hypothetical protein [Mesorhizobium loti]